VDACWTATDAVDHAEILSGRMTVARSLRVLTRMSAEYAGAARRIGAMRSGSHPLRPT